MSYERNLRRKLSLLHVREVVWLAPSLMSIASGLPARRAPLDRDQASFGLCLRFVSYRDDGSMPSVREVTQPECWLQRNCP